MPQRLGTCWRGFAGEAALLQRTMLRMQCVETSQSGSSS